MEGQPFARIPNSFTPVKNKECLCGSGKKFKRCCVNNLNGKYDFNICNEALISNNYNKALKAIRADITQYSIWIKRHTEPVILSGNASYLHPNYTYDEIIQIDVNALAEGVSKLLECYQALEIDEKFHACLERLRENLKHEKWNRKIAYFHVIAALGREWNIDAGRKEFNKLGSIKHETDVEIIQLYIDLYRDDIPFSDKIYYIDKILDLDKTPGSLIHYKGSKAVEYYCIGDIQGAKNVLSQAIEEFQESKPIEEASDYELNFLAMSKELLGSINNDKKLIEDAIFIYNKLADSRVFTAKGNSELIRHIGDAYKQIENYQKAIESYATAYDVYPNEICNVFKSECFLKNNNLSDAEKTINSIDILKLNYSGFLDYSFINAAIAINSGDDSALSEAEKILKKAQINQPIFREIRDGFILDIHEVKTKGADASLYRKVMKKLSNIKMLSTKYLLLQPNFMGIGVDLSKLIKNAHDDMETKNTNEN